MITIKKYGIWNAVMQKSKMDMLQNYLDNHDEAIYLKLPRQITSGQFKEVIGQLKLDGAR